MSKPTCRKVFREALQHRRSHHPFDRISAYKVRESRNNLRNEVETVASVVAHIRKGAKSAAASPLVGCTSGDKAARMKDVPRNIALELGWNLVPAMEALAVEGIPTSVVAAFVSTIKGRVVQLMQDCDAIQAGISGSIQSEYARMKAGRSELARICGEALAIAELAVNFCRHHGVI